MYMCISVYMYIELRPVFVMTGMPSAAQDLMEKYHGNEAVVKDLMATKDGDTLIFKFGFCHYVHI